MVVQQTLPTWEHIVFVAHLPAHFANLARAEPGATRLTHAVAEAATLLEPVKIPDGLEAFVAKAWRRGDSPPTAVTDLCLAWACINGDPAGHRVLWSRCVAPAGAALRAAGADDPTTDEILQEVMCSLLEGRIRLERYDGRGSLRAWIRTIAVRRFVRAIATMSRARRQPLRGFDPDAGYDDPELKYLRRQHGVAFSDALEDALSRLTRQERRCLRHHYLEGMSIDRMASVYHVHRATAARWVAVARKRVLVRIRSSLGASALVGRTVPSPLRLAVDCGDVELGTLLQSP